MSQLQYNLIAKDVGSYKFLMPEGFKNTVDVYLWGAGGGNAGGKGGGGGYSKTTVIIDVEDWVSVGIGAPGTSLGGSGFSATYTGGKGGINGFIGAGGGGASVILINDVVQAVAAGGGGGGGTTSGLPAGVYTALSSNTLGTDGGNGANAYVQLSQVAVATNSCFLPGTLISTPTGYVAIETIQLGDIVYAYNIGPDFNNSIAVEPKTVTKTYKHTWDEANKTTPLLIISHTNGDLIVTPEHEILCLDKVDPNSDYIGFVRADALAVGDIIYAEDGSKLTVTNVALGPNHYDYVYNLEVDDFHTYIAAGIRVHNGIVSTPTNTKGGTSYSSVSVSIAAKPAGGGGGGGYFGGKGGTAGAGGSGGQNYGDETVNGSGSTSGGVGTLFAPVADYGNAGYGGYAVLVFTRSAQIYNKDTGAWKLISNSFVKTPPHQIPKTIVHQPQTLSYTASGTSTFTVPAGVTALTVTAIGGGGGGGGADGNASGGYYYDEAGVLKGGYPGEKVSGTITVTPGQVITITPGDGGGAGQGRASSAVGGAGGAGHFPGGRGGYAGGSGSSGAGGGGGAATVILLAGNPILVAGGGGGAGGSGNGAYGVATIGTYTSGTTGAQGQDKSGDGGGGGGGGGGYTQGGSGGPTRSGDSGGYSGQTGKSLAPSGTTVSVGTNGGVYASGIGGRGSVTVTYTLATEYITVESGGWKEIEQIYEKINGKWIPIISNTIITLYHI